MKTEILDSKNHEYKSEQKHISVKDKLKDKYEFWQNSIKANEIILQIVEEGYMLLFTETSSEAKVSNNKSALTNFAFVQEAIEDMLLSRTIKQVKAPLKTMKPLSVSVNSKGKKRLILHLRFVKHHFFKKKRKKLTIRNVMKITCKNIRVTFSSLI